jgi:hypothetical protein
LPLVVVAIVAIVAIGVVARRRKASIERAVEAQRRADASAVAATLARLRERRRANARPARRSSPSATVHARAEHLIESTVAAAADDGDAFVVGGGSGGAVVVVVVVASP